MRIYHFQQLLEPCRKGRCQRYPRHHRADRSPSRPKGQAARIPQLCRMEDRRPDGQDARGGSEVHERAGARSHSALRQRSPGHPAGDRCAEGRLQSSALGLGHLRRAGAQSQVRSRRRAGKALLRARQRAAERRLLRGQSALRADLQRAQRSTGVRPDRARV